MYKRFLSSYLLHNFVIYYNPQDYGALDIEYLPNVLASAVFTESKPAFDGVFFLLS